MKLKSITVLVLMLANFGCQAQTDKKNGKQYQSPVM